MKAFGTDGYVVSMTGDGVNDKFKTIVRVIEEGRNIYNNIRKAILYLLSCNASEVLAVFSAVLVGTFIPLLPVHILWVNLVTDTFPALALGMDPGDPRIIEERPRDPKESIFARGGALFIALNGVLVGGITVAGSCAGRTRDEGRRGGVLSPR